MAGPVLTSRRATASARTTDTTVSSGPTDRPGGLSAAGDLVRTSRRDVRRRRTRLRAQWLVLAAALTVLAGVLVAWALDRAADRVEVVSVARPVAAGTAITADDLTVTPIAFDAAVTGLVSARSLDALVGRVATIDLSPGALVSVGMWADGTELGAGERTVGAVLEPGTHPVGLAAGSSALAVPLRDTTDTTGAAGAAGDGASLTPAAGVLVRVLDVDRDDTGGRRVTLAVPAEHAADLARLAATESLVLVGVPTIPAPDPQVTSQDGGSQDGGS